MLEVENLHLHAGTHPVACGYSVQFHPESMISEHGRAYLSAFATAVRAWRR